MSLVGSFLVTILHCLVVLPSVGYFIPCCPSAKTSVSVGSTLLPDDSGILLKSYNGTYVFELRAWKDLHAVINCMAAVRNTKISPGSQIWAANNGIPLVVTQNCSMKLSEDGDLSLQFDGNRQAWHTNTGRMGIQNLSLEETGNLILQSMSGRIIWQSFDQSPIFWLLTGMKFTKNTTLVSSVPEAESGPDFSTAGKYAMKLNEQGHLVMYANGSQFVYWSSSIDFNSTETVAYAAVEDGIMFYDNQNNGMGKINPSISQSLSRGTVRALNIEEQSGNLKAFYGAAGSWKLFFNTSISNCENPAYCGEYNLCIPETSQCICPQGFTSNGADCQSPSQVDSTAGYATDCSRKDYQFVEVNVSFPPQLSSIPARSQDECRKICAKNCATCNAALYDPTTSACSLFSELQTLPKVENSGQILLLKILAEKTSDKEITIGVLVCVLAALGLIFILATFFYRKRVSRRRKLATDELFLSALPRLPPRYTLRDLRSATKEFSIKIGSGGFGSVYDGVLPSGARVAVKKLEGCVGQSSDQFRAEVATIGSVSHTNVVALKGFCIEGDERLLVYDHMANGSLDKWLFRSSSGSDDSSVVLEWQTRCRIAADAARGLAYLHHECGERIVHCDVKPENILLDEGWNAKVADFGVAKLMGGSDQSFAMTTLKGTRGYIAPEWLREATITAKSDVYSYGVVLMELVTGRRCIDAERGYLPIWVMRVLSAASQASGHIHSPVDSVDHIKTSIVGDCFTTLLDEGLHGIAPLDSFEQLVCIALSCLQLDPGARPSMATLVQMLDGLLPVPPPSLRALSIEVTLDSPRGLHLCSIPLARTLSASSDVPMPPSTNSNVDSIPSTPSSWLLTPFQAR